MNKRAAEVFRKRDTPVCSMQENEKKKTEDRLTRMHIFKQTYIN